MSKEKILITGAAGQLGTAIQEIFSDSDYEMIPLGKIELNITNHNQIETVFNKYRPTIVINCAAYNKVEDAGEEIMEAFSQNAFGPYWLALESKSIGATLIHISTDYVFDGKRGKYTENDCPCPLNVYGTSKLAGERLAQATNPNCIIIRTSWLFGLSLKNKSRNFVTNMLARAKKDVEVRVVNDQWGCPTYTSDLAIKIRELLEKKVAPGIYHVVNDGPCTWYDFAKKIFELTNCDSKLVPITTEESGTRLQRPRSSILISSKLKDLGVMNLRPWSEALLEYLNELNN